MLLRPPDEGDAPAIATACADAEIARFIPVIPTNDTEQDAAEWIGRAKRAWRDEEPSRPFVITDAETGELLGAIEIRLCEGGTIGYWAKRGARGRGIARRALVCICRWAREELRINRLVLLTHPHNRASQRVAESAGFRRIGTTAHEPPFGDRTIEAVLFELA